MLEISINLKRQRANALVRLEFILHVLSFQLVCSSPTRYAEARQILKTGAHIYLNVKLTIFFAVSEPLHRFFLIFHRISPIGKEVLWKLLIAEGLLMLLVTLKCYLNNL